MVPYMGGYASTVAAPTTRNPMEELKEHIHPPCYAYYKQIRGLRLRCMLKCKHKKSCRKQLFPNLRIALLRSVLFLFNMWMNGINEVVWWKYLVHVPYLGLPVFHFFRFRALRKKALKWFEIDDIP